MEINDIKTAGQESINQARGFLVENQKCVAVALGASILTNALGIAIYNFFVVNKQFKQIVELVNGAVDKVNTSSSNIEKVTKAVETIQNALTTNGILSPHKEDSSYTETRMRNLFKSISAANSYKANHSNEQASTNEINPQTTTDSDKVVIVQKGL